MKKQMKKLKLAKETLQKLDIGKEPIGMIVGGQIYYNQDDTMSVYWSCVCTGSGMYTCAC
ncbi:MAG TPA: hypothetical protein VF789_06865 [Thermoanaerobaculia bacterium]